MMVGKLFSPRIFAHIERSMDVFSETLAEAREKFLAASAAAGAQITTYPVSGLRGEAGELLATDVACLGPETAERVAIVISGTHGAEGFCGSAIQTCWLSRPNQELDNIKLILVHAINPWAFSYRTRSDENNIDINRNFIAHALDYRHENLAYDALAHVMHADPSNAARALELYRSYTTYLDQHGWQIENEIWEGQWHRPDGLMYGGRVPAWSNVTFRRILSEHLAAAEAIGFIDSHTGVGSFGEIVHLIFDSPGSAEYQAAVEWWNLKAKGDAAFKSGTKPNYRGLLCQAIRQERPGARVAGAVIEFGTADHYSIFRADILDRWLRFEGRDHPDAGTLRAAYQDIIYPRDISWRRLVEQQGPLLIDRLITGVAGW
jgi:uncharacterized protein DUF2817